MDGNKSVMQMLDSSNMPTLSFMFELAWTSVVAPSLPSLAILVRTHECSTIQRASFTQRRKGAQRKSLFFAPLRALRETSFSSNDGITRIPRNISTRTDLCITSRAGAWEPANIYGCGMHQSSLTSVATAPMAITINVPNLIVIRCSSMVILSPKRCSITFILSPKRCSNVFKSSLVARSFRLTSRTSAKAWGKPSRSWKQRLGLGYNIKTDSV